MELFNSTVQHLSKRAKSQLYGVFGLWWVIFHWGFFYSLFFLDQELIFEETGLLKDTYLKKEYFNYQSEWFWIYFVMPFVMTYITIRWLPLVLKRAYKKEKSDDFDMQSIRFAHDKKIENLKVSIEEKKIETLEKAEKRVEKEKKIETRESEEWSKEYAEFRKNRHFEEFSHIVESVYEYQGRLKTGWNSNAGHYEFEVPLSTLTFAHTNDIVLLDKDRSKIELTDKGKYFVKRFTEE